MLQLPDVTLYVSSHTTRDQLPRMIDDVSRGWGYMVVEYLASLDRDHEGDVEIVTDHVKFFKTELASMAERVIELYWPYITVNSSINPSHVVHVRVVMRDYDGTRGKELNPFIKNVSQQVPDVEAITFKDVVAVESHGVDTVDVPT